MSWWSSKSPIEQQIEAATSEDIPTGEQNLALNLEICDEIRSKRAPAKDAVKVLRKRLYDRNPNVQVLTLHLLDLCIKNGGAHFLEEVASKEFMFAFSAQLTTLINQNRNDGVVDLMLEYLQTWALMTKDRAESTQIYKTYQSLKGKPGIVFPEASAISSTFADSATAPEWVDSDTCMKSGRPFTFYNRKHHCRNCGGVYMQEFCSNFLPLPQFGIVEPVRVCDDCKTKLADKYARLKPKDSNGRGVYHSSNNRDLTGSFDEDLRRALEQSLRDSERRNERVTTNTHTEEMDEDMKAAIAASLADMERARQPNLGATRAPGPPPVQNSYSLQGDQDAVDALRSALDAADPKEVFLNPRFAELMRNAESSQPRVLGELNTVANKLQTLEDLHGRLSAISGYYDRMLDLQLRQTMPNTIMAAGPPVEAPAAAVPLTAKTVAGQLPSLPQTTLRPSAPAYNPTFATYSAPPAPAASLHAAPAPAASLQTAHALSQIPAPPTEQPAAQELGEEQHQAEEVEEAEPEPEPVLIEL